MSSTDRVQQVIDALRKQLPHLDYSAKAVAARLVRLGTVFITAVERVAAMFGLSSNEYVILCVLRAGGAPYTLPPKAITPLMPLSSGGMTNILHGLAERGLIERLPDPSDGRGVLIRMTPAAVKLINQAIAAHVAEERRMITHLTDKERGVLERLLSKLLIELDPVEPSVATRSPRASVRRKPTRRSSGLIKPKSLRSRMPLPH